MSREKTKIDTSKIATDLRLGLSVGFSWSPKRRELFILRTESQNLKLPSRVKVPMLFDEPLRQSVNLVSSRDYHVSMEGKIDMSRRLPRFTLRVLRGAASRRDASGTPERYLISRFVPFLSQHVACGVGDFKCKTCPMYYPCVMGQIPLGMFVTIAPSRYSPHHDPDSVRLFDTTFDGCSEALAQMVQGGTEFTTEFLRDVCDMPILYGYQGLFEDYPAFEDCFYPIPTRRS